MIFGTNGKFNVTVEDTIHVLTCQSVSDSNQAINSFQHNVQILYALLRIEEQYSEHIAWGSAYVVLTLGLKDACLHKMATISQVGDLFLNMRPVTISEVIQIDSDRGFSEVVAIICNLEHKHRLISGVWAHLEADVSVVKTLTLDRISVDSGFSDPVIQRHHIDSIVHVLRDEENAKFITNSDSDVLTISLVLTDFINVYELIEWKRV